MPGTLLENLTAATALSTTDLLYAKLNPSTTPLDRKITVGDFLATLIGWYNVKSFGARGDGTTDDTVAIQAAINAVVAAGGGTLYFPVGVYVIGGALQDTGDSNCQIKFPTIELNVFGQTTQQPTLRMIGPVPPPTSGETSNLPVAGYAVLKSTQTGGSGTAAVFANQVGRNNLHLQIENLILQLPPDPSLTGWNLANQNDVILRHLLVHAGHLEIINVVQPTHGSQFGIIFPQNNHTANSLIQNLTVWGCYTGYKTGELCIVTGGIMAESCIRAVLMPFSYHANVYSAILIYECPYGLVMAGDGHVYFDCHLLDFENANGQYNAWQNVIQHIDDPSNFGHGKIRWHQVSANLGVVHTSLTKSGATGFTLEEMT